jgi:putative nucleotidyltransferase with HDIG domain
MNSRLTHTPFPRLNPKLAEADHVLVVDDQASSRLYIGELLRSAHFRVSEATNGEEALEAVERLRPDLVLLDVLMPNMSGLVVMGEQFGRYLGLSRQQIKALRWGGYLHDIGKVGIPDAILCKQGKHTPEEWEIMKSHVLIGEDICRGLRTMQDVLPIIRHHHERWDGSGYPDGLAGEEIPLLARVFQVIDIFDALTSPRPYKPALTAEQAIGVLREETRKGWRDPNLVREFCDFMFVTAFNLVEAG